MMRKERRAARTVRRIAALGLTGVALTACGRLDELVYTPLTTPQQWCEQRPCFDIGSTTFSEPLGSMLVFALAALWIGVGVVFISTRHGQRSRLWLGIALALGGLGAAQAGVSYQLLSYPLKCEGWDFCRLTNGLEVGYSLTQAFSVSAMLTAVAFACTRSPLRTWLIGYSVANAVIYVVVSAVGVMQPNATLLSFTVLMAFALPGIIAVLAIAALRYRRHHDPMDRAIAWAAILLIVVQIAYFAYYAAGITEALWNNGEGFYFSANDVLHVGMIAWLIYVWRALGPRLRDTPNTEDAVQVDTSVADGPARG